MGIIRIMAGRPERVGAKDGLMNNRGSHDNGDRIITPRGDYKTLLSFPKAEVIYDITFALFIDFLRKAIVRKTR